MLTILLEIKLWEWQKSQIHIYILELKERIFTSYVESRETQTSVATKHGYIGIKLIKTDEGENIDFTTLH